MRPTNQRFFNDVVLHHDDDACLVWPFSKTLKGYPHMFWKGRWHLVTRRVCEHFHGPAPTEKHQAAHSCRELACVNWRHLRWATPSENEADKIAHGTYQYGERNPQAKLTVDQVLSIRAAIGSHSEIAAKYDVSRRTIGKIKARQRWNTLG